MRLARVEPIIGLKQDSHHEEQTMSSEVVAAIAGGVIGIMGSMSATFLILILSNRRRAVAIRAIVEAEIIAIQEKAERYIGGHSTLKELGASTPMLTSITSEIGFLSAEQAVAFRRSVTLDMEMRTEGSKDKAVEAAAGCRDALKSLGKKSPPVKASYPFTWAGAEQGETGYRQGRWGAASTDRQVRQWDESIQRQYET